MTNDEVCDRLLPAIRAVADHNESQVLLFVDNLTPVINVATATLEDLARLAEDAMIAAPLDNGGRTFYTEGREERS